MPEEVGCFTLVVKEGARFEDVGHCLKALGDQLVNWRDEDQWGAYQVTFMSPDHLKAEHENNYGITVPEEWRLLAIMEERGSSMGYTEWWFERMVEGQAELVMGDDPEPWVN